MTPVTKTFLPPIEEYTRQLKRVWKSKLITNRGQLVLDLESKLKEYLDVPSIIITANGTLPIQIGLKVLANMGEVITTPFSFVATTASVLWQNCTPVFVDIDPKFLTIDETKIEEAITSKTTAILATHVFGNPCNIEAIELIATKHNLKVIYDGAHCFGVKYNGNSIFKYGDMSTCSFHATKLFHTGEGGAIFCNDEELKLQMFYSHNFGYTKESDLVGLGINGKISELQAGMGLSVLSHIESIIAARKEVIKIYDDSLDFTHLRKIEIRKNTEWNNSYYPVIFEEEEMLLAALEALNKKDIFPRRYFYPSLNNLNYVRYSKMRVSEEISKRILCLPLFVNLKAKKIKLITDVINRICDITMAPQLLNGFKVNHSPSSIPALNELSYNGEESVKPL